MNKRQKTEERRIDYALTPDSSDPYSEKELDPCLIVIARFQTGKFKSAYLPKGLPIPYLHSYDFYSEEERHIDKFPDMPSEEDYKIELESRIIKSEEVKIERYFHGGGYVLMVNRRNYRTAVIQRYDSMEAWCSSCDWGALESRDGIRNSEVKAMTGLVSCEEMLRRAQLCIDPEMPLRTMQKGDIHFLPVSTLYSLFEFFYKQFLLPGRKFWKTQVEEWKPRVWNARSVKGVVRMQAKWRGSLFRRHVLYSPHTELGKRFLMQQWKQLVHDSSLTVA